MSEFVCGECGAKCDGRCEPQKCEECGCTGCLNKVEEKKAKRDE